MLGRWPSGDSIPGERACSGCGDAGKAPYVGLNVANGDRKRQRAAPESVVLSWRWELSVEMKRMAAIDNKIGKLPVGTSTLPRGSNPSVFWAGCGKTSAGVL